MIPVYKSEIRHGEQNPEFSTIKKKLVMICGGDKNCVLKFTVKQSSAKYGDNWIVYGYLSTTLDLIIKKHSEDPENNKWDLYDPKKEKAIKGSFLQFSSCVINEFYSFADYLKSGWNINMTVAVDYTASNGNITNRNSLHYLSDNELEQNQYETAMEQVGKILNYYAYRKKYIAYGFGGIPNHMQVLNDSNRDELTKCFPINGVNDKPTITGLPRLIELYRHSLPRIKLFGPTFFAPVLNEVYKFIQSKEDEKFQLYHVLLILTDGGIQDMRETIDAIVKLSDKPLSIIIVGIGDADFSFMDILDADDFELVSSDKKVALRDIVQFVKYNDFKSDLGLLAEHVLCEVPDQLVSYMNLHSIVPTNKKDEVVEEIGKKKKKKPSATPDIKD